MNYLKVKFDNDKSLDIYPFLDDFSQTWYQEVLRHVDNIDEDHRLYGINDLHTEQSLLKDLHNCIDIVKLWRDINVVTEDLNELHTFFEDMMEIGFFDKAPSLVKKAIKEYNVIIHHLESLGSQRIVCTFKHRDRYELDESMQPRFNFNQKPGTVCINYCQVGKPLYDIYHDNDSIAQKISPQDLWSADFTIIYKHGKHKPFDAEAKKWCRDNDIEPRSWGLIDVGMVETPMSEIYGAKKIKKIEKK